MSNFACASSLPTAFATSTSQNITKQHQTSRPPRSSRSSSHHEDVYNPQKPQKHGVGGGSHDEMDMHTLGTASTSAATSSYSMTDDASDASEVGMEVVMSCVGGSSFTAPTTTTTTRNTTAVTMHSFTAGKETFTIPDRYTFLRTVGSGAYGVVISAQDTKKNTSVAIKMVPRAFNDEVDAKRILREIKLMKHLCHENIVSILDMMPPQAQYLDDFQDVYIVADLMETDLHRIIYSKQTLSIDHVQYFVYQMLRGLKYIHSANVIHRDLKPSNLLVNSNCDLKICDFGLARGIHGDDDDDTDMETGAKKPPVLLTEYVVTRWYRAPEIMLACNEYSKPVDVWSVGCIFAELILRKPYFPGDDYIDQLTIISEKLGKVPESDLDFVTSEKAKRFLRKLPDKPPISFSRQFPGTPRNALDLLRRMLHVHPKKRITIEEALEHPFFAQLHSPQDEPKASKPFDFMFEQREKLTRMRLKELIWREAGQFRPSCLPVPPPRNATSMNLHEA